MRPVSYTHLRLVGAVGLQHVVDLLKDISRLALDVQFGIARGDARKIDETVVLHGLRQNAAWLGANNLAHGLPFAPVRSVASLLERFRGDWNPPCAIPATAETAMSGALPL